MATICSTENRYCFTGGSPLFSRSSLSRTSFRRIKDPWECSDLLFSLIRLPSASTFWPNQEPVEPEVRDIPGSAYAATSSKGDILVILNLEDTPKNLAPFAIERSRGVVPTVRCCPWQSTLFLSGFARSTVARADPKAGQPSHIRSSLCPHETETNRDFTASENRKSLDGSVTRNYWLAQQTKAGQRIPQLGQSQSRCRHEYPGSAFSAVRTYSRCSQKETSTADRHLAREARFAR